MTDYSEEIAAARMKLIEEALNWQRRARSAERKIELALRAINSAQEANARPDINAVRMFLE